jgi:hypothetical protein
MCLNVCPKCTEIKMVLLSSSKREYMRKHSYEQYEISIHKLTCCFALICEMVLPAENCPHCSRWRFTETRDEGRSRRTPGSWSGWRSFEPEQGAEIPGVLNHHHPHSAVCFSIRLSFEPMEPRTSSSPSHAPGRIERPSELAVLVSFLTALSLLRRHMEKDKTEGGGKEQTRGNN